MSYAAFTLAGLFAQKFLSEPYGEDQVAPAIFFVACGLAGLIAGANGF